MPMIPEARICFRERKNSRGRKTGEIQAILKDAKGQEIAESAHKTSKDVAVTDLLDTACKCIEALRWSPDVLRFRGRTVIIFPTHYGNWTYAEVTEKTSLHGCSHYDTKREAEMAARDSLALSAWDKEEETSPIITDPKRQQAFTESVQHTKRYWFLLSQGWSEQEAQTLMSPLASTISQARIDEMPPLPEWVPYPGKERIDEYR